MGIAIVGANLAGASAARTLRENGYDDEVYLIGEENVLPYERPPLSKEFLSNPHASVSEIIIHDEAFYNDARIELELGVRCTELDIQRRKVSLSDGRSLSAENIILCTGSRPRKLQIPGSELEGIFYLRTLDDARAIAPQLTEGAQLVLIGMGVIGAEVAASARKCGCSVVAIEPQAIPMARTLGPVLGNWLADIHRSEGVDVRLQAQVTEFKGGQNRVDSVVLKTGEIIAADLIVVGVGVEPAIDLASNCGIKTDNGIVVDSTGLSSVDCVYAAGDVANRPLFEGGRGRCETYQNAIDMGTFAARAITGTATGNIIPAWFWSDQYDLNIQSVGSCLSSETVIRGNLNSRSFTLFYLEGSTVTGAVSINRPRDMAASKRMVEKRAEIDRNQLGDEDSDLRHILKAALQSQK